MSISSNIAFAQARLVRLPAAMAFIASLVAAFFCLPAGSARAGTLVVEIAPNWPDRQPFIERGRTVWVYVSQGREGQPRRSHIVGKRNASRGLDPVRYDLPPGNYRVDLVKTGDNSYSPFLRSCAQPATIAADRETRLRFPVSCRGLDDGWASDEIGIMSVSHAMAVEPGYLDGLYYTHLLNDVGSDGMSRLKFRQHQCKTMAAPLAALSRATAGARRSGVIFIDGPWIGGFELRSLESREFDAQQVRRMVKTLEYMCWTRWRERWLPPGPGEQDLAAKVQAFVASEINKLDRFNAIAERLEEAGRGRSR